MHERNQLRPVKQRHGGDRAELDDDRNAPAASLSVSGSPAGYFGEGL